MCHTIEKLTTFFTQIGQRLSFTLKSIVLKKYLLKIIYQNKNKPIKENIMLGVTTKKK